MCCWRSRLPSLLGARQRAHDVAARSTLRTATTSAIVLSEFRSDFTFASAVSLDRAEPGYTYLAATEASTGPRSISIDASNAGRWVAAVRSESGRCFAVVLGSGGQVDLEPDSCAASDIDTAAPAGPGRYSGDKVHDGTTGAVTAGMCLEVVSGGFVEQQPCSSIQRPIRIYTRPDGLSTISSIDGNCFGTEGPHMAAGIVDKLCVESVDQLWTIVPAAGGLVQFKNAETGWCMDVYGDSSAAGARLIQWGYGTSPNGTCKPVDSPNNQTFSSGERPTGAASLVACRGE
ncbi:MAG: RICIN domain-containing protein [Acidimicrobiales bacterium]